MTYHGALDPRSGGIAASVRRIGVIVPGTNASLGNASAELARAQDLAAESGSGTAYFTWRGGPMPEFSPHGAIAEPAAQSFAEVSSPRLATFMNGLALPPGAELTPIAHSYGAVVLGGAERQGLRADRVVYVAPAGLGRGIRGLQDFPATGGQPHFVLQARNDGVVGWNQGSQLASRLGLGHGRLNPLTAPGIVRLETGYRAADDPGSGRLESEGPIAAHSNPFTAGSTALRNVVAVVEGREVTRFDATSPRWERAMDRAPAARRWASLPPVAGELISSRADGPTP
ncbi:alpha/beta hydrolase [Leucobacter chromiireducens]|uniref:alpha/beta hydrolase n=1 Tax=Leucobacter chromiireducens TaxID=283877 RepID=UPI0013DDAF9B|nr:alpha/beta hydrolase [Leucobacter chromiireducens]